jgi:hypothetical protein
MPKAARRLLADADVHCADQERLGLDRERLSPVRNANGGIRFLLEYASHSLSNLVANSVQPLRTNTQLPA